MDGNVILYFRPKPYESYSKIGEYIYKGDQGGTLNFESVELGSLHSISKDLLKDYQFIIVPDLNKLQIIFGRYYLRLPVLIGIIYWLYTLFNG